MISLPNFPHRVRIHGGGFDASARAMHRKAAIEMVSIATIERIQMSTKTTLKRVSLVAVAALGFGLLSVVPSSAVVQSDTLTLASATTSVANGATATVNVTQTFLGINGDSMSVTASLVSSPSGNSVVPTLSAVNGANQNVSNTPIVISSQQLTTGDTGSASVYSSASVTYAVTLTTPTVAGTYVVKLNPTRQDAVTPVATAQTWTVTVGSATAATADTTSTAYKGVGVVAGTSTTDAVAINVPMATAATAAANIAVTPLLASAASSVTLTASISGPGNISIGSLGAAAVGRTQTETTASSATRYVNVWADGTARTSTITISQGSTVLATKTVTFYGAIATVTTTLVNSVLAVGSTGANVGAITAVAKDSGGNTVPVGTLYVTSDASGVVSNSYTAVTITAGVATATLTGVAAGTANITVGTGSSSTATSNIVGAVLAVRVGATANAVALSWDKASYSLGESATLTVTLTDAAGKAVPNAAYANIFTAQLTSTFALGGVALPTGTITTTGSTGTATYVVTMPTFASDVTVSGTGGTALAAAQAALTVSSPTISIANPAADAATDAANAATDAANYAADAADAATTAAEEATAAAQDAADAAKAAQDSADAATAAVVDLGLKVTGLIASLRAQLTSLTNLIVAIQAQQAKTAAAIAKLPKK